MKRRSLQIALVLFAGTASAGESYELKLLREKVESRQEKLESVEEKIKDLELVLAEMKAEAESALKIENSIEGMIAKARENRITVEDLESKVRPKVALLTEYRKQFQVKYEFEPGESLGDFTTQEGRGYKAVILKEVNDDSIRIAHSNGFAVVAFTDLPDSLADRITEPPSAKAMMDIAAVLDERPNALKTKDQIYNDRKNESNERYKAARDARANETAELREQQEKSRAAGRTAADAERQRRMKEDEIKQASRNKSNALREGINTLNAAISQQEAAKDRVITEMQVRPIRPSKSNFEKAAAPYDRKIASLKAAIAEKTAEMRKLK
ncbi:hypothetical protein OAE61_01680 [Verrucomicrobiales bacterium]|nr:hypothetical protein [Verrucomicrobiales bacterium]MDB4662324.1 hypothetical protein [Verrucomicrobiales bacterium]